MDLKKIIKYAGFISGMIFIVTLAVISYIVGIQPGSFAEQKETVKKFTYDNLSTYEIKDDLVYESGNDHFRIYLFDDMVEIFESSQSLNKPTFCLINKDLFIYEKNGKIIQKIEKKKIVHELSLEDTVIYDIIEIDNDLMGVICKKDNFRSSLLIFDKTMTQIFERAYSEVYVTQAKYINKKLYILLNSSVNEEISSYIEVVNMNPGIVLDEYLLDESLHNFEIKLNAKNVAVLSEKDIHIFKDGSDDHFYRKLSNKETIYDVTSFGDGLLLLIGNELSGYETIKEAIRIEILEIDGDIKYSFGIESSIERLSYVNNKIIGISKSGIFVYNKYGEFLNKTVPNDIIEEIIESDNEFYFIYIDRIDRIKP